MFAGSQPPEGYQVVGVVTAECTLLNGASGVFDDDCTDDHMMERARQKAADSGGTALVAVDCVRKTTARELERTDAGVALMNREVIRCQMTVLRRGQEMDGGVEGPSDGRKVEIAGVTMMVRSEPGAAAEAAGAPRPGAEVGEIETGAGDYPRIATVRVECLDGCSRAAARSGLKEEAGRVGAIAIANVRCELLGERWRCQADAIGDVVTEPVDATSDPAVAADGGVGGASPDVDADAGDGAEDGAGPGLAADGGVDAGDDAG